VSVSIPKFAKSVPQGVANFGIGTLVTARFVSLPA
jgi:hypothetical protein